MPKKKKHSKETNNILNINDLLPEISYREGHAAQISAKLKRPTYMALRQIALDYDLTHQEIVQMSIHVLYNLLEQNQICIER